MRSRYYLTAGVLALAAAAAFGYALPHLPDRVAIHWNLHGEADGFGSPWHLFFAGPGLMAGTMLLFAALPWLSPKRFEVHHFERTYLNLMLIVVALIGYIHAVALASALAGPLDVSRALVGGICVMAILIGNLLGKVRRNFFIGIRTPWTLASERVWYATHRWGARVAVGAGLLGLVGTLLGAPVWIGFALVIAGFLAPVVYSLVLYKHLERTRELDVAA